MTVHSVCRRWFEGPILQTKGSVDLEVSGISGFACLVFTSDCCAPFIHPYIASLQKTFLRPTVPPSSISFHSVFGPERFNGGHGSQASVHIKVPEGLVTRQLLGPFHWHFWTRGSSVEATNYIVTKPQVMLMLGCSKDHSWNNMECYYVL